MKFSIGDLVIVKENKIHTYFETRDRVGVVIKTWPIEDAKEGYVYDVVRAQFGKHHFDLPERDYELVSRIKG